MTTPWAKEPWSADVLGPDCVVRDGDGHALATVLCFEVEEERPTCRLMAAAPALMKAAEAALLFHSLSPWDAEKAAEWKRLTGTDDATTKALCDFIRAQIAKVAPAPSVRRAVEDTHVGDHCAEVYEGKTYPEERGRRCALPARHRGQHANGSLQWSSRREDDDKERHDG